MKCLRLLYLTALLALCATAQDEKRTFTNTGGKTIHDRIIKFDYEKQTVTMEDNGNIPLDHFNPADQEYILHWNQVAGFTSTMRFKTELKKETWARLKHEQNITPYYMDAIQMPGKTTPSHLLVMLEDYEKYSALYLEAEGFSLKVRNQNFFPIENIVVESKVLTEQEQYQIHDDMFASRKNIYDDTVTTNRIRFTTETIPIIIPREEVFVYSPAGIIIDQQVEVNVLSSAVESDEEEEEEETTEFESFGDFDDHGRRRRGRVRGVWFRVGIKGLDGEMVWRDFTSPTSLKDKWESFETFGLPESQDDD
jgi:hypothetical protein